MSYDCHHYTSYQQQVTDGATCLCQLSLCQQDNRANRGKPGRNQGSPASISAHVRCTENLDIIHNAEGLQRQSVLVHKIPFIALYAVFMGSATNGLNMLVTHTINSAQEGCICFMEGFVLQVHTKIGKIMVLFEKKMFYVFWL